MSLQLNGSANCLAPGVQVGHYRLQDVVGEGGFGIVYQARDLSLDRTVAIKEYMPATLAGRTSSNEIHVRAQHKGAFNAGLRSFINEARLLAKFSHPALVHVYHFFEENGTAYMVMRYYEGQTFRSFLAEQQSRIDERWLSTMLAPILDVLEMLHTADCYHRDIAPDNVFLQTSGMPVLLDFGAARRIIGDMTQALTMVLKPGFAPIEQYADDGTMPQGPWTDIYQLGAMLYLAITGKVPPTSVARMINDPVRALTPGDHPGYSARFLNGVHCALAVKPLERPQSIGELKVLLGVSTFAVPAFSAWAASSNPEPAPVPNDMPDATASVSASPVDDQALDASFSGSGATPLMGSAPPVVEIPPAIPVARPLPAAPPEMATTHRRAVPWKWWALGAVLFLSGAAWWWQQQAKITVPPGPSTQQKPEPVEIFEPRSASTTITDPGSGAIPGIPPSGNMPPAVQAAPAVAAAENAPAAVVPPAQEAAQAALAASGADVKPAVPVDTGRVVFRVSPWGNIKVNRQPSGVTPPLTTLELPEGRHQIEVSNPAAPPMYWMVQVKKGEPVVINHRFE